MLELEKREKKYLVIPKKYTSIAVGFAKDVTDSTEPLDKTDWLFSSDVDILLIYLLLE